MPCWWRGAYSSADTCSLLFGGILHSAHAPCALTEPGAV